jgi:hypothetical protein
MKRAKKKSASGEQQRDSSLILVWWRPGSKPGMHGRRKPLLLFIEKPFVSCGFGFWYTLAVTI